MLSIVTKANDFFWYEFTELSTIDEIIEKYGEVIINKNHYSKKITNFWPSFKAEDAIKLEQSKYHITILSYNHL